MLAMILAAPGLQGATLPRIDALPDRPAPYRLRDFRQTARDFDRVVFDAKAQGPYLPLTWSPADGRGLGMPSYVGKEEMRGRPGEGITTLGALVSGVLVGVDKSAWLDRAADYFNPAEGAVLNYPGAQSGQSFWYELLPAVNFVQLASRYPRWKRGQAISQTLAGTYARTVNALDGDFNFTAYDLSHRRAVYNGRWREPDSAGAMAYILLLAGRDAAARRALKSFQHRSDNPTYEIHTGHGAISAAYLNATAGTGFDTARFVNWCLEPTSPYRPGWGMATGRWNNVPVGGLIGSTTDGGGYAFAMNSFLMAGTLAPIARYDDRLSVPMAKWILNLANAAGYLYADSLPAAAQSSADWTAISPNPIPYEGIRREWEGVSPFVAGDARRHGWAATDFALYGGAYSGFLGALIRPTGTPMILRIDLNATDFLPGRRYPTALYWNPHPNTRTVRLDLGAHPVRLYDAVANRLLTTGAVKGGYRLRLRPRQAAQIVQLPAQGSLTDRGSQTSVNGVVIDYRNGR